MPNRSGQIGDGTGHFQDAVIGLGARLCLFKGVMPLQIWKAAEVSIRCNPFTA
jgi:hypothetical protein